MIKIDLHTHSVGSYDGGLSRADYAKIAETEKLDVIAITDHRSLDAAKDIIKQSKTKHLILGQEMRTTQGEMIGLFLKKTIPDGLSPQETAQAIRKQRGFILIPHPMDKHRDGMNFETLGQITEYIDAIEAFNGRTIGKPNPEIRHWAKQHNIPIVACSDAHGRSGIGWTYTMISGIPSTANELRECLEDGAKHVYERPPLRSFLAPKYNRLKKLMVK
jgi:predicted metal-dependent phosphoesterase TrpH